jgi:hypothetical protein
MPRSYRGIILALAGLILVGAQPPQPDRQHPSEHAGGKIEDSLEDIATALREANKTSGLEKPCQEGDNKRPSDLCAQWKAADAADSAKNATWLFGGLGTLIGALTLGAASAAAFYAKRAADHTKRGADTAERTLTDLEQPYLFVDKVIAHTPITRDWIDAPDDRFFEASPKMRNYGRTPAVIRQSYAHIYIGESLPEYPPTLLPSDIRETEQVIAPGETHALPTFYRYKLTSDMVADLFSSRTYVEGVKPTRCYIYGYVRYASPYDIEDEFGFIWEFLVQNDEFYQRHIPGYTYRKRLSADEIKKRQAATDHRSREGEGE